jgi:hypothetical protein
MGIGGKGNPPLDGLLISNRAEGRRAKANEPTDFGLFLSRPKHFMIIS